MDGKNLTPQNAPGSTIGNLGGVLPPPRMPIFAFIGQPPCYRVSTMLYCHCERSEAIPYLDCFVTLFLAMTLSSCHCNDQRDYLFYADTLRLAAGSFIHVSCIVYHFIIVTSSLSVAK